MPLPIMMKAPGRFSSMKEKSSAPVISGMSGRDLVVADDPARHAGGDVGLLRMVDQRRVAAVVMHLGGAAIGRGQPLGGLAQPALDGVAHLGRIAARRAADHHLGRDDVGRSGRAAGDVADADHRRLDRRDVAADDGLDRQDEMRQHHGRVGRQMRGRAAMAAGAAEGDGPGVGRRHHRAGADAELADRAARHCCACRRRHRPGSGRTALPRPSAGRRPGLPRPAGR